MLNVELDIEKYPGAIFVLYDMLGREISINRLVSGQTSIDIQTIQPGNYLYEIRDSNGEKLTQGKIVKL